MIITKKFNIINNELKEIDNMSDEYDVELSVYCTLNIYTGEAPCTGNCKNCKYNNFKEKFSNEPAIKTSVKILSELGRIRNSMLEDLHIQKDYFIDSQLIRTRMEVINICLDSISKHGYLKTIDTESYGEIYRRIKKIVDDSRLLHYIYFKYKKNNDTESKSKYESLKYSLLEYVHDTIEFLSKYREEALEFNTKVAIEKIKRGEY